MEPKRPAHANDSPWGQEALFSVFMGLVALLGRGNPLLQFPDVLWAFGALLAFNLVYHWVLAKWSDRWEVSFVSVTVNSLLISGVLYASGGSDSSFWPLYLLPIFTACLRLERRHVFWAVAVPAGFLSVFSLEALWQGNLWEAAALTAKLGVLAFSGGTTMGIAFRERAARRALEENRMSLDALARADRDTKADARPTPEPAEGPAVGVVLDRIQNPLTVIMGSAELLTKEIPQNSVLRRDVDRILQAAQAASHFTSGLAARAWAGPAAPRHSAATAPAPSGHGSLKILVVDDDDGVRDIGARFLKAAGYQVTSVESGDAAVRRLAEGWDIVLSDIDMPGEVRGNEMVRRVRKETAADILLMTAYPELSTAVEALRDGAYDYIMKPFNEETLLASVRRCAEKRQLSRELAREKALRAELEKAQRVKEVFGQFVTPEVARFALGQSGDFWKRGSRQSVTVLFADVRKFTPFAGRVPPEEVVEALNGIFSRVTEAVQREGGILNKFMGDGLLAIFGAPLPLPDHAAAAARAALAARAAVEAWAKEREAAGLHPLRIGIGLNSGEVVAGCLGSKDRTEYSVIGHAVNLSARLEEQAAPGQILVGPDTASTLAARFRLGDPLALRLAGVQDPLAARELLGVTASPAAEGAEPLISSSR